MRIITYNPQTETRWARFKINCFIVFFIFITFCGPLMSQQMPDVRGTYEDYPVNMVIYWQSRESLKSVQVAVLRDPSGEQEARFDLTHGATLISLRYHGKELLFAALARYAGNGGRSGGRGLVRL